MEKIKSTLEAENVDMANEIKQLNVGKQESERKRKQAESQLQELTLRLAETERSSGDQANKVSKMQVCKDGMYYVVHIQDTGSYNINMLS